MRGAPAQLHCQIDHRTHGRVVDATREANLPERGVAERHRSADLQTVAALGPGAEELEHPRANLERHAHGWNSWVGTRQRIVEQHLDGVTCKPTHRPLETIDELP